MAKFTYKGTTSEGEHVTEIVDADDKYAVYDIARTNGHAVQSVEEVKSFSFKGIIKTERINSFLGRVKMDELVTLTRNLSSMIKAGLPLTRSLTVIERQSKKQKLKDVKIGRTHV